MPLKIMLLASSEMGLVLVGRTLKLSLYRFAKRRPEISMQLVGFRRSREEHATAENALCLVMIIAGAVFPQK
jgi:hypothetical protein